MVRMIGVARGQEPLVLVRGMVGDEVGDDAQAAMVGLVYQGPKVVYGSIVGVDAVEIGDIVAVIPKGRRVDGQQPETVDAQSLT